MKNTKLAPILDLEATSILETERQKTDDSLTAERLKTNESLADAVVTTERRTDKLVEEKRIEADQIKSLSRLGVDANRKIEREKLIPDATNKLDINDSRLLDERRHADRTIEKERSQIDLVIDQERNLRKTLENSLLAQEREKTDKNLLAERDRTDSEVHHVTNLLSDQIVEHSKTKASLSTRDEFLAIVSHDLKNPLGTISLCAEMLLENSSHKEMDPELKSDLELIKRNADTALRLIADILDMERIEEGKLQLQFAPHCMNDIIRECVKSFAHQASAKSTRLSAVPSIISGDVLCDRDRIMQVLSNLIGNALKFTPEGGSIVLNASLGETEVQVSVRDTGPGIPDKEKDHIFARFSQLGSKDRSGLGLGLYISKMLIEAHRGRLWVQSKVGEGSTFCFTFPKIRPDIQSIARS